MKEIQDVQQPLVENKSVRQRPDEGFRRWFMNDYFDLIVWYRDVSGPVQGFQLCYSRHRGERAFTWQSDSAASHFVSDGTDGQGISRLATGILTGDAGPVPPRVLSRLEAEKGDLPDELLTLILQRVGDYNDRLSRS